MSYIEAFAASNNGYPAAFVAVRAALDTVLTATITPPGPGCTLVLCGVDASVAVTGVSWDAWITFNPGGGKNAFASGIIATSPDPYEVGTWRGFFPFAQPSTIELGVECFAPADLAINAWGLWLPTPLVFTP